MLQSYAHRNTVCLVHTELADSLKLTRTALEAKIREGVRKHPEWPVERYTLRETEFVEFKRINSWTSRAGKIVIYRGESIRNIFRILDEPLPKHLTKKLDSVAPELSQSALAVVPPQESDDTDWDALLLSAPGPGPTKLPVFQIGTKTLGQYEVLYFTYHGERVITAPDLEKLVKYAPKTLAKRIREEWANEFQEGRDFDIIQGAELAAFNTALLSSATRNSNHGRLLVLYESGVNLVLVKTEKHVGIEIRRWLTTEVMPSLARYGEYRMRRTPDTRPDAQLEILGISGDATKWSGGALAMTNDLINQVVSHGEATTVWARNAREQILQSAGIVVLNQALHSIPSTRTTPRRTPRQHKLDGALKLEFDRRKTYSAVQLCDAIRKATSETIDPSEVERLADALHIRIEPWIMHETRVNATTLVWDADGCAVIIDHLQTSKVQTNARLVEPNEDEGEVWTEAAFQAIGHG